MFGILLQIIGTFTEEVSESLGKDNVRRRIEKVWTLGFLNALLALIGLLFIMTFIRGWDAMTMNAWPTFAIRAVLLVVQSVMTIKAIVVAERSTFGFLRVGTIPLILAIDMALGVALSGWQVVGMLCIAATILLLSLNHGLRKKGIGYVLFGTIASAIQLSLLSYNITHGNTVELEQLGVMCLVVPVFYILARQAGEGSPFAALRSRRVFAQSSLHGAAMILGSYAFLYAPASVLLATARGSAVMASVLTGHWFFHERKFSLKIAGFVGCAIGIILLMMS
jgi:hypothetical protein